jgi:predicted glycosyltransferase
MLRNIWIDVLTPKQAMLLGSLTIKLISRGYNTILTTRDYDYTQAVLHNLGLKPIVIGRYGSTVLEKLIEDIDRMRKLVELLRDSFDIAIAYPNPVAARIAFGLSKPYIALTDSPHSEAASRLSIPLASYVVFSRCIPEASIEVYVYKEKTKLVQYNGVDEVEWLKDVEPDLGYIKSLELEPYGYVVARPPEVKASYYRYPKVFNIFKKLIDAVLDIGFKILYLPRYRDDPLIPSLSTRENVVIPSRDRGVIGYHVVYYAVSTITGGGTLAREAALLGTYGISLYPEELYVDKCVRDWGLPLARCRSEEECLKILYSSLRDPEKYKSYARSVLKSLEKPSDAVFKILEEVGGN